MPWKSLVITVSLCQSRSLATIGKPALGKGLWSRTDWLVAALRSGRFGASVLDYQSLFVPQIYYFSLPFGVSDGPSRTQARAQRNPP